MKIALYCPNKTISDPDPSGDLVISRGIRSGLNQLGHDCREIAQFRARWFWKSPAGWSRAFSALFGAYENGLSFQPDLWLTYHTYYKSPDVLGPWASRLLKVPYVLFQPMYSTKRRRALDTRLGFYLNKAAIKASSHAFTNNMNDLEALERLLPSPRITYLSPGIFPEDFTRNEEAGRAVRAELGAPPHVPLLMTAARFRTGVKYESVVYLLRSLALLRERRPDFRLLVVGDGPMEGELRAMSEDLLPGLAIFSGRVAREEMFRYYSAADVFVFPGIGESLGMVFLEAQACALPVVALDTAGVPQVVKPNATALLVPKDGGHSMACAVETLLADPRLRREMGGNGQEFITKERNLHKNYLELSRKLEEIVDADS
jgi:glycosyltransferase involved in cell wall biosynthesis